jgi:hypothetical protein
MVLASFTSASVALVASSAFTIRVASGLIGSKRSCLALVALINCVRADVTLATLVLAVPKSVFNAASRMEGFDGL